MALFCRHEWGEVFEKRLPPVVEEMQKLGRDLSSQKMAACNYSAMYATMLIIGCQCKKCGQLRISEHRNGTNSRL